MKKKSRSLLGEIFERERKKRKKYALTSESKG